MGFEQLAALKEQLAKHAKQAQQERQEKRIKQESKKAPSSRQKKTEHGLQAASPSEPQNATPVVRKHAAPVEPVNPVVLAIGRLQKHFPQAFPKNPAPKVPLKLGIHKDLLTQAPQLGLSEAAVIEAIKTWCWGKRYWACLVENACRIDLAGQEVGRVLATEAARARALEARRFHHAKKVARQQEAVAVEPQQQEQEQLEQSQDAGEVVK